MANNAETNKEYASMLANAFKEVDWLIPAYMSLGFLSTFAAAIQRTPTEMRPELLRRTLPAIYNPEYLASMFIERYSKIIHVKDFSRLIGESIEAYFSGLKIVAITALIPAIEGIVRKMANRENREVGSGTRKLILEFDALVEREENSPNCYGERLVMLQSFRDFMRDRFLENTTKYDGLDELNRHGIVHGIFDGYGEDVNFFRIITLLDLLCFSIGLIEGGISGFAPEHSAASLKLSTHYATLQQRPTDGRP